MDDVNYLRLRAQQELTAAINSTDRRVRNLHLELADAYSFRLRQIQAQTRALSVAPAIRPSDGSGEAALLFFQLP